MRSARAGVLALLGNAHARETEGRRLISVVRFLFCCGLFTTCLVLFLNRVVLCPQKQCKGADRVEYQTFEAVQKLN